MAAFTLLDQADEDKLHAARLLRIEERPFSNISKRILGPDSPFTQYLSRHTASEANGIGDDAGERENRHQKFIQDLAGFRESMLFDFASFASTISRFQLLRAANEKERARYANEKLRIEATAEDVRQAIGELRVKLDQAQDTLRIRKEYDVIAAKITKANLKPRDAQNVAIEKLRNEIEELERESAELSHTWQSRREQLAHVVSEAQRLRRQIRNEKEPEEVEAEKAAEEQRKMLLDVDDGKEREAGSHAGTPRPDELGSREDPSSSWTGTHGSIQYSTVTGYFLQDDNATNATTFSYADTNFGLINQSYPTDARNGPRLSQWQSFNRLVDLFNELAPKETEYKAS
ncbi:hypothetical protein DV737_g1587, partial [Chaetothyriales sp. CBS 132003]